MADSRRPIESLIRLEAPPEDVTVVMRGGPISVDKIVEHALRQQSLFLYRGEPMVAVSVDLAVQDWTIDRILRDRMRSRSRYATSLVATLRTAGYELVPTATAPHYSLVLPGASPAVASALLACFGPTMDNPFRSRR